MKNKNTCTKESPTYFFCTKVYVPSISHIHRFCSSKRKDYIPGRTSNEYSTRAPDRHILSSHFLAVTACLYRTLAGKELTDSYSKLTVKQNILLGSKSAVSTFCLHTGYRFTRLTTSQVLPSRKDNTNTFVPY